MRGRGASRLRPPYSLLEDFADEEMALIAGQTEASAENVSLDAELKDWEQK